MTKREKILCQLWDAQGEAYELMNEYDSLPHCYGETTLYQAEAYIVNWIGKQPDITITELADNLKKTPSACSQIVRKLVGKELVKQVRNENNKRIYNLRLTAEGMKLYEDHIAFNRQCQQETFEMLDGFSEEELAVYLKVQQMINRAYQRDVDRSRRVFGGDGL